MLTLGFITTHTIAFVQSVNDMKWLIRTVVHDVRIGKQNAKGSNKPMAYIHADELIDGFREFQGRNKVTSNQLSNEELNRELHTAMGLCWHEAVWDTYPIACAFLCQHCRKDFSSTPKLPHYCESLDAVAKVRDFTIERVGKITWGKTVDAYLGDIDAPGFEFGYVNPEFEWMATYTTLSARQIASICFEALGLTGEVK